jgi:hypothetical protein
MDVKAALTAFSGHSVTMYSAGRKREKSKVRLTSPEQKFLCSEKLYDKDEHDGNRFFETSIRFNMKFLLTLSKPSSM